MNQTEQHLVNTSSQIKRQKPIKSIGTKNAPVSKLTTEPYEKQNIVPLGQRHAIERIFETVGKNNNFPNNRSSELCMKKNVLTIKEVPQQQQKKE